MQYRGPGFDPWVKKIPWIREWLTIPVFFPGEFHGQRSLAGYSPWSCKESLFIFHKMLVMFAYDMVFCNNIHHITLVTVFFFMKKFTVYSLGNFQVYDRVLFTIVNFPAY